MASINSETHIKQLYDERLKPKELSRALHELFMFGSGD
jgi:hypothetical protein